VAKKKKKKTNNFSLPEEIKKWLWGSLLFLGAVIVVLSFFEKAGIVGEWLMLILSFLLGQSIFLIPLALVLGGVAFLNSEEKINYRLISLAVLVLILGVSGLLATLYPESNQGGKIGFLLSYPFLKLFGKIVSEITFVLVIFVSGLLFWYLLGKPRLIPLRSHSEEKEEEEPISIKKLFKPDFKVKEVADPEKEKSFSENDFTKKEIMKPSLRTESLNGYKLPPFDLLETDKGKASGGDIKVNSAIIKRTLQNFDIQVEVSEVNIGPTVTQYALKPAEGIKLSRITSLSNDLSMALASHPIRIEAPIPGRPLVGIEVPNSARALVRLRGLLEDVRFQNNDNPLLISLGRDVSGSPIYANLAKMPHLLVAGATGTGKTICLNDIILSFLYRNNPEDLNLILVDPKRVEFHVYNNIPHLMCPVIVTPQKAINALKWLTEEMERRFDILSQAGSKNIKEYDEARSKNEELEKLPYIVLIIDELADLMAARGREMEAAIVRLAQMSRAVGIHLILATQRPSVEVITGLIKANITSRITFQVASQADSRTVLDMGGAEKLLGAGDLLFISAEKVKPRRIQGAYVTEKEVKKVVKYIVSNSKDEERKDISDEIDSEKQASLSSALEKGDSLEEDPLFEEAKEVVIEAKKASASLLQRRLRVGYARAARLIDSLEERGVVGPGEGAKPRKVFVDEGENQDY
jgi:S-DNA-T family DNA segregation ATPase FtsK/SpoIIIE